jgi:hypothetical protein
MPYRRSDDLWAPLALLSLGLLFPGVLWALSGDLIALYASAIELTIVVTTGYALLAWYLIDRGRVDRTSFLLVSLIWPWPLLIGLLMLVLLLNQGEQIARGPLADVFRAITADWPGSIFGYGAVFAGAGIGIYLLTHRYHELARTNDRLPSPSRLLPAIVAVVVLLAVVATGANAVVTRSASIDGVGPGTRGYHDPTFNVSVDGPPAEYRVTVTAPDGTSRTARLSRQDMRGGSGTVAIELEYADAIGPDELPVRDGTYRVRVSALGGTTVDTATFEADDAVGGSLEAVPVDETHVDGHEPYTYYQVRTGGSRVGFVITNDGAFHAEMSLLIRIPDDPVVFDDIPMAPGERRGVVFRLDPETVISARAKTGGRVTVELYASGYRDEALGRTTVTIPPLSA